MFILLIYLHILYVPLYLLSIMFPIFYYNRILKNSSFLKNYHISSFFKLLYYKPMYNITFNISKVIFYIYIAFLHMVV